MDPGDGCETYLEHANELSVADVAVLVGVESVEYAAQLLSGEEDSELGKELLEFKSAEDAVLVLVKAL